VNIENQTSVYATCSGRPPATGCGFADTTDHRVEKDFTTYGAGGEFGGGK